MHKRFTDIHKWQDPWFRKLSPTMKLLWIYICDHCDNAGVWKVDVEIAGHYIGMELLEEAALACFNGRVKVLSPEHWLINKFVEFQFGELSQDSPLHKSVLALIERHTLKLAYPYPKTRVQVKEKDKVKDKDNVKDVDVLPKDAFDQIWAKYPRKLGREHSKSYFKAQVKTQKDWKDINTALERFKAKLAKDATEERFIPHGSTWFNKRWKDWISYEGGYNASNGRESITEWTARQRAKRETEGLRKATPERSLSTGFRDLSDVQTKA